MKIKFTKKIAILSIALMTGIATGFAQLPPGMPGDGDMDDTTPPDTPIDGFIIAGLVAGAAIGLRKNIKKD